MKRHWLVGKRRKTKSSPGNKGRFAPRLDPCGAQLREVVRRVHDIAGGTSVYKASAIQRRLRDAQTMTQHMITNATTYEMTGRVLLAVIIRHAALPNRQFVASAPLARA